MKAKLIKKKKLWKKAKDDLNINYNGNSKLIRIISTL